MIQLTDNILNIDLEEKLWKFCEPFAGVLPEFLSEASADEEN